MAAARSVAFRRADAVVERMSASSSQIRRLVAHPGAKNDRATRRTIERLAEAIRR